MNDIIKIRDLAKWFGISVRAVRCAPGCGGAVMGGTVVAAPERGANQ
jgi:hypothetical protein